MLTTTQIIIRLLVSLVFGLLISVFVKKEKGDFSDLKIYPVLSLVSAFVSLFSLEIFLKIYSKTEMMLLPAVLLLGLFFIARALIRKGDELNETIVNIFYLFLIVLVGLSIGLGLYRLAIFATFLFLIFITFSLPLEKFIQKLRQVVKI